MSSQKSDTDSRPQSGGMAPVTGSSDAIVDSAALDNPLAPCQDPLAPTVVLKAPAVGESKNELVMIDETDNSLNDNGQQPAAEEYGTSRMRFVVVAIFAIFGFVNQVQYTAYATIVREAQDKFSVSALEINLLSLLIPVVYCLFVVPGCWYYTKVGLRYGMITGGAINALGSILKFIAVWAPKYPIVVIAQIFVAFGQVLYLSLPPLIAARWYPVPQRTVVTAVCSLFGFFGMAVGMFYSPRIVSNANNTVANKHWAALMGSQMGLSLLVVVLMLAFVAERPKKRPCVTADRDEEESGKLWGHLRHQFKNINLLILALALGGTVGCLSAVAGVLTQILEPFGISEQTSGILAFAGIMGGAANCALVGFIVDRSRRYRVVLLALTAAVLALLTPAVILSRVVTNNKAIAVAMYIIIPLLELLVLPLVPVTMELSVELTYPDPETVSSTLVLMSMCLISFIGMVVFSVILGDFPTKTSSFIVLLIALCCCAVSFVGMWFVKERRLRHKQEQSDISGSNSLQGNAAHGPTSHSGEDEQR